MNNQLVDQITKSQIRTDLPEFKTGDTIKVMVRIIENKKERQQAFQGLVIARRGSGVGETFIVRKMSSGIGVEEGRHLVDEGPGTAGAVTVHAVFVTAGQVGDLRIFAAEFDDDVRLRIIGADRFGTGNDFL